MKWPGWTGRRAAPADALYRAAVAVARQPRWYEAGGVPDTVDGRFDMVALVAALLLRRLEREPDGAQAQFSVDLTERFIADMDGSLRQLGVGDPTVGKQVGHMVAALGGRLGAYREALTSPDDAPLGEALARNLYRGAAVAPAALAWAVDAVRDVAGRLDALDTASLRDGRLGSLT